MLWIGLFLLILSTALSVSWYTQHKGDIDAGVFSIKQLDVYFWLGALCGLASTAAFIFSLVSLTAPYQAPPVEETSPEAEPLPPLTDYVEIVQNSEDYNEQEVLVAGRISEIGPYDTEIKFTERMGFRFLHEYFLVVLMEKNPDLEIGQYILVKGIWNKGEYGSEGLKNGEIFSMGTEAEEANAVYLDQWHTIGKSYADTLPIVGYMDIVNEPEKFNGQRIRTFGQIDSVEDWLSKFYFSNQETGEQEALPFSWKGCPEEMKCLCKEGDYILLSGIFDASKNSFGFRDCYIEAAGIDADVILNGEVT